jgi:hypothetical protein
MNNFSNKLITFLIKTGIFLISFPTFSFGLLMIFFGQTFSNPNVSNLVFFVVMGVGPTFLGGYAMLKFVFNSNLTLQSNSDKKPLLETVSENLDKNKITKKEVLHSTFYELLEIKGGKLTSLNFAMEVNKNGANISGKEANDFLIQKAKEFNHQFRVGENGEVFYDFEYLSLEELKKLDNNKDL